MFEPGLVIVPVGPVVSRCHVHVAGEGSVLPAASVARTAKVCALSVRPPMLFGLVQGANAAPSTLHSNVDPASEGVKVKLAAAALDGSACLPTIVVCGAVRSPSTLRMALDG